MRRRPEHGILAPFRSLLTAQVIGAALGLVFWVLVARLVPAHDVGVAAAAISAQTLLGTLTSLGLGTMLISELPKHDPARQRRLVLRSLFAVTVAAAVIGGVMVALSGLFTSSLREALDNPVGGLTFVLGVAAAGWAIVTDESTLGLKRSGVQVGRNLLASSLRFPITVALLALGLTDSLVLQLCWVLPLVVSVPAALLRLGLPRGDTDRPSLRHDITSYVGPALRNHALNLSVAAGSQLVPVIAGLTLSSVTNAEFTIAWLMASFVFLPPYLLAIALFAYGANISTEEFRSSMQTTIPASLALSTALVLGAWLLGEPVLRIFGGRYSSQSYEILALLVPAGLWMVFKDHLVALWRTEHKFGLATRLAGGAVVLEVAGAAVGGALYGPIGLCLGWLGAMVVEILVAVPWLRQAFGGLHFTLPVRLPFRRAGEEVDAQPHPAGDRGERGVARPEILGGVGIALVVVVIAAASMMSHRSAPADQTTTVACSPTAARPGPLVDLGIQAATGRPRHPLLSKARINRLAGLAQAAGASVISTSANWANLRPSAGGRYDFTGLDRVVAAADRAGLQVRVQLTGMPVWAQDTPGGSENQPPLTARELTRWRRYTTDVMTHLRGKVAYLEVWNEPDGEQYWPTGPDPLTFARLLRTTYDAAVRADPDVQVVTGGLSGNDIGYLEQLYDALDDLGSGPGKRPFDLVGVHPFAGSSPPGEVAPGREYDRQPFGAYDENFVGYRQLHETMAQHGDGDLGIYIGEFGYSTVAEHGAGAVPDDVRASYLTDAFQATTCTPYVAALSWYYLHPTPWDPAPWTLVDARLRPNLTYRALQEWTSVQPGRASGSS